MPKPLEAWQGRSASLEEFEEGKKAADDIRSVILGLPQFKDRKIDPYALAQAFGADPAYAPPQNVSVIDNNYCPWCDLYFLGSKRFQLQKFVSSSMRLLGWKTKM